MILRAEAVVPPMMLDEPPRRWRDLDAGFDVAQGLAPGDVGPDEIALDQVPQRPPLDVDAVKLVGGDDVGCGGRGPTDGVG